MRRETCITVISVVLVLAATICVTVAKPILRFDKTTYLVSPGSDFKAALILENGSYIAGVNAFIYFNSSVVHVVSVTRGDFVERTGGMMELNINNTAGFVKIAVAGARPCKVNKTVVAYITFKVIRPGRTLLRLVNSLVSNINGNIIEPKLVNATVISEPLLSVAVKYMKNTVYQKGAVSFIVNVSNVGSYVYSGPLYFEAEANGTALRPYNVAVVKTGGSLKYRCYRNKRAAIVYLSGLNPGKYVIINVSYIAPSNPGKYVSTLLYANATGRFTVVHSGILLVKFALRVKSVSIPSTVLLNTPFYIKIIIENPSIGTLHADLKAVYDDKILNETIVTIPGSSVVTREIKCILTKAGVFTVRVYLNGTLVAERHVTVVVPRPRFILTEFKAPELAFSGYPFKVNVSLRNIGLAPGVAIVRLEYDGKICGKIVTPPIAPGAIWRHTFVCTIPAPGNYVLSLYVNSTEVGRRILKVYRPGPLIRVVEFTAPEKVKVNETFNVVVTLKNIGVKPGTVSVEVAYDDTSCGKVTAKIEPGTTWHHVFSCTIPVVGKHVLKLLLNGTEVAKRAIEVFSPVTSLTSRRARHRTIKIVVTAPPPVHVLKPVKISSKMGMSEAAYRVSNYVVNVPGIVVGFLESIAIKAVDKKAVLEIRPFTIPEANGRPVVINTVTMIVARNATKYRSAEARPVITEVYIVETNMPNIVFSSPVEIKIKLPSQTPRGTYVAVWNATLRTWIPLPTKIINGYAIGETKVIGPFTLVRLTKPQTTEIGRILINMPRSVTSGNTITLTVKVYKKNGRPATHKLVMVFLDNKYVAYAVTDNTGKATVRLRLTSVGIHTVRVYCDGISTLETVLVRPLIYKGSK